MSFIFGMRDSEKLIYYNIQFWAKAKTRLPSVEKLLELFIGSVYDLISIR